MGFIWRSVEGNIDCERDHDEKSGDDAFWFEMLHHRFDYGSMTVEVLPIPTASLTSLVQVAQPTTPSALNPLLR